jgi:hypothetical protein
MKETSEMPKVSRESAAHVENHGPVEDRHEDLDGYMVNFVTFAQTIDATPLFEGLPGGRCSCPHWGYIFKGKITYRFADHEEVFEAGDAFYVPEGHSPIVEEGTEFVQFSPAGELQTVSDVMMKNAQALGTG